MWITDIIKISAHIGFIEKQLYEKNPAYFMLVAEPLRLAKEKVEVI